MIKSKLKYRYLVILPCFILMLALLSSCGNPTMNILLKCTDDSNNNNAVQIRIFQLKSAEKFNLADRESILRSPEETLGDDLIPNTKVEKIMVPGESFNFEDLELTKDSKYLGIIADFHTPAKDGWSQLIDLSNGIDDLKIIVAKNFLTIEEAD